MKNLYNPGQVVETTVVAVTGDTVFIDLGLKSEGFVGGIYRRKRKCFCKRR